MPVKSIASLLLALMLSVILGGVCDTAHAEAKCAVSWEQTAFSIAVGDAPCPCCPAQPGSDHHGCDASCDCACHVSLTIQSFSLGYRPVLSELRNRESLSFLPEVFLSKFIPPQLRV